MTRVKQKRMTKQKKLVYSVLASTKSHPTADWVYEEARKVLPDISLGTVYRNLQVLSRENQIQELTFGKAQSRFDANPHIHYHFVCKNCGAVLDCENSPLKFSQDFLDNLPGESEYYRLEFYGVCSSCLEKTNKKAQ